MKSATDRLPVAVIGAGPVGLAAAAHLLERGLTPLVLEAGTSVGANLDSYRHVQLFSPWRYNIDKAAARLLAQTSWHVPDLQALTTAGEIVDAYLRPLAALPAIAPFIRTSHRVVHMSRRGVDKVKTAARDAASFTVRVHGPGGERDFEVSAIIDASGTWNQPNPLGASGVPALGEAMFADRIAYGMPDILGSDRNRYARKSVLVVGAGHSAAGNLIALATLAEQVRGTRIAWAIRGSNFARIFGGGEADGLPARGQLGQTLKELQASGRLQVHTNFRVHELVRENGRVTVLSAAEQGQQARIENVDEIIAATGARPNLQTTRELRLKLDPWLESTELLAPLIDPNEHSCGTVRPHGHRELAHPEPGYYAVGARSYGRAPTFLMATGYEQVRSVVAALAGDLAAADDVQLDLPQTGVCSVSFGDTASKVIAESCCGGPPVADASACCVSDEQAKASGKSGCGCGPGIEPVKSRARACCG